MPDPRAVTVVTEMDWIPVATRRLVVERAEGSAIR